MAQLPNAFGTDSNPGWRVGFAVIVMVLSVLVVPILVGYGPLLNLAPSPGADDGQWAQVESIDATQGNETAVSVTVTYQTGGPEGDAINQFTVPEVPPGQVDSVGDWAYLPKSRLPAALAMANGNHSAGVQTLGPWVLVGNLSATTEMVRTAPVTVVAPSAMDVDPARKAYFLSTLVSPYQLQPERAVPATIAIAPNALPADGLTHGRTGYVTQHAFWDGKATSVWIHEYLHTQQTFETAPEMEWFREASATYLSLRMMEEEYFEVEEPHVREWIADRNDFSGVVLADEVTWNRTNANYYRGARLLYEVDAAIRDGSDREHTLVDVFRAMNAREEPVTLDTFISMVESYSGEPEPWLRKAITESGDLDGEVPQSGAVFGA